MRKEISPEERLLKLIKHKGKEEEPPLGQNVKPRTNDERPHERVSRSNTRPAASGASSPLRALPYFKNIVVANRVLLLAFLLLLGYFFVDYFMFPPLRMEDILSQIPQAREAAREEPVKYPYTYFENEIKGKDVFRPLLREEDVTPEVQDMQLEEVMSGLSLLGVVAGANPQAIIQDNKKNKTHFLNEGDKLGETSLKEIQETEGRVIMIYKGKEFDLAM